MNDATQTTTIENVIESDQLAKDFKVAVFIVSIMVNVTVLTAWTTLQFIA